MVHTPMYVTFVSYKGGVGRTSALMNTARQLAKRKKRVLLVDLDLSAPGIDIFDYTGESKNCLPSYSPTKYVFNYHHKEEFRVMFSSSAEYENPEVREVARAAWSNTCKCAPGGFVEFFNRYSGEQLNEGMPRLKFPKDLMKQYNERRAGGAPEFLYLLPRRSHDEADIIVMRAGAHELDAYYDLANTVTNRFSAFQRPKPCPKRVTRLDQNVEDDPLRNFVNYFKNEIVDQIAPDYVLVDARPGRTDVTSFALRHFSDAVVLCFNLNPWNLRGASTIYDRIVEQVGEGEPNIILVASPIPEFAQSSKLYDDQYGFIRTRMRRARTIGSHAQRGAIEIPYADILLLRDVLVTDLDPVGTAAQRYDEIADLVIRGNPQDLSVRVENARRHLANGPQECVAEFERLQRERRNDPAVLFEFGKLCIEMGRYEEARIKLEEAWAEAIKARPSESPKEKTPYHDDIAYELARVERLLAWRAYNSGRGSSSWPVEYRTVQEKYIKRACQRLRRVMDEMYRDSEVSSSGALYARFHALVGAHYYLDAISLRAASPEAGEDVLRLLDQALKEYDEAKSKGSSDHQVLSGQAQAAWLRQVLSPASRDSDEDCDSLFKQAVEARYDYDTLFERGRYLLFNSFSIGGHRISSINEKPPYMDAVWSGADEATLSVTIIDEERLIDAETTIRDAIKLNRNQSFAHFHLGMAQLLRIPGQKSGQQKSIEMAISPFRHTAVLNPSFAPAYFYDGLLQFLRIDMEAASGSLTNVRREVHFRQAFYRFEHVIDMSFRLLTGHYGSTSRVRRTKFYFDSNQIDAIKGDHKMSASLGLPGGDANKYVFARTVEFALGLPPLVGFLANLSGLEPSPKLIEAIAGQVEWVNPE